jgi:peptide/nickel transport system substrate-binding protein
VGVTGGGAKDIFDGQNIITKPDQARLVSCFETLLTYDQDYKLVNDGLAEEVIQDSPMQYTIRLRKGITFHNGKTLSADDVIYSLQRILDKSNGLTGYAALSAIDPTQVTAMDASTVRLVLKTPNSTIPDGLAAYTTGIVPVGYKGYPSEQIGTGAYKLQSFTPGQRSVSMRNDNYWRAGQPYFDTVTIIDFPDATAQANALLGGQVDAITDLPPAQVAVAKGNRELAVLNSKVGSWLPLCMAVDMAPFDDARVRQAMRLLVDRQGMVDQVLSGYGRIANDLYSPFDADYASDLPQRARDVDQAKALLKAAGQENLTVDLNTTPGAAGMVETATVFATQAKQAGVTINVKNVPNYYGDQYLKLAFSVDFWGTRNYLAQVAQGSVRSAPYNETHWPPASGAGSNFQSLYEQALAATDASRRGELVREMQKLEYENGGYIIPFFNNLVDAHSIKVQGLKESRGTLNLDSFGHGYRTIWFG